MGRGSGKKNQGLGIGGFARQRRGGCVADPQKQRVPRARRVCVLLKIMKLAFIGLGKMGSGMARNLLRAGHELTVYNRSREKSEALSGEGARVAASPAEACRNCEAVLTMLSDDRAVEGVVEGPEGIASGLAGGTHISCSTISTAMARRLAAGHSSRGQGFASACVFGRPEAAEAGKLIVMAAGAPALIEHYRPVF